MMKSYGTTFFSGVPDSILKDFCGFVADNIRRQDHIIAGNEGAAVAHAIGHRIATGKIGCVYLENSFLGSPVNPLLSSAGSGAYSIPVLLLICWRGETGIWNETQTSAEGQLTASLLDEMGVPYEVLPDSAEGASEVLDTAYKTMEEKKTPFALLVREGTFETYRGRYDAA